MISFVNALAGNWLAVIACVSLLIWIGLVFLRGGFWKADQQLAGAIELQNWPSVVAVIPARNEEETIGQTVQSLLSQDYPGELKVIVVDDNSDDGTRRAAGQNENLRVVAGKPLEDGWTGKLWAVSQGISEIRSFAPGSDYVLLTDADIAHHPENLRELVSKAISEDRHLVSLMVRLRCSSFWEKLLIPAFVFFFQKLYPFPWVNSPDHPMAAAAGGCMLIRLESLHAAGGIAAIKDQLIDDCAMGRLIKTKGAVWLGLSEKTESLRAYTRLSEIWNMVARTAFVQLDHSPVQLLATVLAMVLIYLAPPILCVYGLVLGLPVAYSVAGAAYLVMIGVYGPTLRLYKIPLWAGIFLPLAGFLYTLMTISSAIRHWQGHGGAWKGRSYSKTTREG